MTTIIFKSETNAKIYSIQAKKTEGIYKAGEEILKVKTDNIEFYMKDYEDYIAVQLGNINFDSVVEEIVKKALNCLEIGDYKTLGILQRSTASFFQMCMNEGFVKVYRDYEGDILEDFFFIGRDKIYFQLIQGNHIFKMVYSDLEYMPKGINSYACTE
jgi:hypothetical protein